LQAKSLAGTAVQWERKAGKSEWEYSRNSRERIAMTHQHKQSKPKTIKNYIMNAVSLKLWMESQAAGGKVQSN
jgi:hypothetical protein